MDDLGVVGVPREGDDARGRPRAARTPPWVLGEIISRRGSPVARETAALDRREGTPGGEDRDPARLMMRSAQRPDGGPD